MKWGKLGIIERPLGTAESVSHCYLPTPVVLSEQGILRVYYSSWDMYNRGRIFYSDFDLDRLTQSVNRSPSFVLDIGEPGTFDADGVAPLFIQEEKKATFLFYQGFMRTAYPKINTILASIAWNKTGKFERWAATPFFERTPDEPFIRSTPYLLQVGDYVVMWYTSSLTGWKPCTSNKRWASYPLYDIAVSRAKGIIGLRTARRQLCHIKQPNELGAGRPCVIYEDGLFKMWFSYRSEVIPYQIGYAESIDGVTWIRRDDIVGIGPDRLYDNEMLCFPMVIDVGNNRYMFYNGNEHGKEGIALAILEQD